MTDLINLDREGPVGTLRFLQPTKRNPYSMAFVEQLVTLLREADQDDAIRVVVMTGGDHFSSGGDLVGFQSESLIQNGVNDFRALQGGGWCVECGR